MEEAEEGVLKDTGLVQNFTVKEKWPAEKVVLVVRTLKLSFWAVLYVRTVTACVQVSVTSKPPKNHFANFNKT